MEPLKDRIAGELLWHYVEQVREAEARGEDASFTRAELEELVGVLSTAGSVPAASAEHGVEGCRAAVRSRLERQPLPPPPEAPAALPVEHRPAPAPRVPLLRQLYALSGALAGLVLAVGTVNYWHRPARPIVRPARPEGIEPIDERQAHELIPQLVHNKLPAQREKSLMWHLIRCRGCFDEYRTLRADHTTLTQHPTPPFTLVKR